MAGGLPRRCAEGARRGRSRGPGADIRSEPRRRRGCRGRRRRRGRCARPARGAGDIRRHRRPGERSRRRGWCAARGRPRPRCGSGRTRAGRCRRMSRPGVDFELRADVHGVLLQRGPNHLSPLGPNATPARTHPTRHRPSRPMQHHRRAAMRACGPRIPLTPHRPAGQERGRPGTPMLPTRRGRSGSDSRAVSARCPR